MGNKEHPGTVLGVVPLEVYVAVRAELYCYFCGHGLGEVVVPTRARRPSLEQLRAAYGTGGREAPVWDESDQPLCPRCGGQLFLERFENEVVRTHERRGLKLKRAS
jgi:hypothetical protein